jgi:tetratricopeptide (TPR) repeat protein
VSGSNRVRSQRILREADGYLELGLPQQALNSLDRMKEPTTFKGQKLYLTGEAFRAMQRYSEASDVLEESADLSPSNIQVWLALGWCYKRTGRLERAISALERAHEIAPQEPIIYYNLACYYSLTAQKQRALDYLSQALAMQPDYRDMIGDERDFDPLRSDPDFQALTSIIV